MIVRAALFVPRVVIAVACVVVIVVAAPVLWWLTDGDPQWR